MGRIWDDCKNYGTTVTHQDTTWKSWISHHSQSAWTLFAFRQEGVIEYGAMGLSAVLRWKLVPGISRPCPWFTPHSANLPGFNQSAPWLMKCFFSSFFSTRPTVCFPSLLFTLLWTVPLTPSNTFVLSLYLFCFPCLRLPICMLMSWRCLENVAESGSHSHTPSPAFLLASYSDS